MVLKRLNGLASEHLSGINVFTTFKYCWNKYGTIINPLVQEYEVNWVGKSLPYSNLKS